MNEHDDYRELALLYPLGGLEAEDQKRLESHLAAGCDECHSALRDSRAVADELALAVAPAPVSAHLKERLVDRIERDRREGSPAESEPPRSAREFFPALAAAVLAAVALGAYALSLYHSLELETRRREELESELASFQETLQAMSAPATRTVALTGQGEARTAQAKAFLDPENRRIFLYVYNLPPPPPGSTYQLWVIVDGTPVSAGTFDVRPDGGARYDAASIPEVRGSVTVAVTVEPSGGVPQPTGPMVLAGS